MRNIEEEKICITMICINPRWRRGGISVLKANIGDRLACVASVSVE